MPLRHVARDRLRDDVLHVLGIDPQRLTDVHRPDLRAQVVLEVDLTANLGTLGLAVLTDEDERREEDRLQADHQRQQPEGEAVEDDRRANGSNIECDPRREPRRVEVDEWDRSRERRDAIRDAVLGISHPPKHRALVADPRNDGAIELAVLNPICAVDRPARWAGRNRRRGHMGLLLDLVDRTTPAEGLRFTPRRDRWWAGTARRARRARGRHPLAGARPWSTCRWRPRA